MSFPIDIFIEIIKFSPTLLKCCHLLSKDISARTTQIKLESYKNRVPTIEEIFNLYLTDSRMGIFNIDRYTFYSLNIHTNNPNRLDIWGSVENSYIHFTTVKQLYWQCGKVIFGSVPVRKFFEKNDQEQSLTFGCLRRYLYGVNQNIPSEPLSSSYFVETSKLLLDVKSYFGILLRRKQFSRELAKQLTLAQFKDNLVKLESQLFKKYIFLYLSCLTFGIENLTYPYIYQNESIQRKNLENMNVKMIFLIETQIEQM